MLVPKKFSFFRDGIDHSFVGREHMFEVLPTTAYFFRAFPRGLTSTALPLCPYAIFKEIMLVPEQLALLRNGINDSLSSGKDSLKISPPAANIFRIFPRLIAEAIPLKGAILRDSIDDRVASKTRVLACGEYLLEILPPVAHIPWDFSSFSGKITCHIRVRMRISFQSAVGSYRVEDFIVAAKDLLQTLKSCGYIARPMPIHHASSTPVV